MVENWIRWFPLDNIPEKMHIESLVDDVNGTLLLFKNDDDSIAIRVNFEESILSMRSTDEGRRLRTLHYLTENYGTDFYTKWTFFKVKNSDYVRWFNEETYNMYESYDIEHYVFLSPDDIVEVLSTYEPDVVMKITNGGI